MVGCHGRAGHPGTGTSVVLLAVHANYECLVLRSLLADLKVKVSYSPGYA